MGFLSFQGYSQWTKRFYLTAFDHLVYFCSLSGVIVQVRVVLKRTIKGATSRITHLEKTGKFFQVCHPQSVLISLSRSHPCLVLVYYYFFGVFLPKKTIIWRFPLMRKQFCQIRKNEWTRRDIVPLIMTTILLLL